MAVSFVLRNQAITLRTVMNDMAMFRQQSSEGVAKGVLASVPAREMSYDWNQYSRSGGEAENQR